jgi:monoamine oxidase
VFGPDGRGFYTVWTSDGAAAKIDASVMGYNAAAVFTGGALGHELETAGPEAQIAFALDRVADVFGRDARKHVIATHTTAWCGAPNFRGSWACALPGAGHERPNLAGCVDDQIFFAGEATMVGHQGSCHGAYLSGLRAADEIATALDRIQAPAATG